MRASGRVMGVCSGHLSGGGSGGVRGRVGLRLHRLPKEKGDVRMRVRSLRVPRVRVSGVLIGSRCNGGVRCAGVGVRSGSPGQRRELRLASSSQPEVAPPRPPVQGLVGKGRWRSEGMTHARHMHIGLSLSDSSILSQSLHSLLVSPFSPGLSILS